MLLDAALLPVQAATASAISRLQRLAAVVEKRPWWLLRLHSLVVVLASSLALLALAFLIVLGPLALDGIEHFAPGIAPHQLLESRR
jgi:hypothetical protein